MARTDTSRRLRHELEDTQGDRDVAGKPDMRMYTTGSTWQVAAIRAVIGASITGALGFLAAWANTDEIKILVSAGVVPFLTYLGMRLGVEGVVDARK